MILKTCTKCRIAKPLSAFSKGRPPTGQRPPRKGFGVISQCRECLAHHTPWFEARKALFAELAAQGLRRCSICQTPKPVDAFNKDKNAPDGRTNACRECRKEYLRRWRLAHPNAYKQWHAENREERLEYLRVYGEAHKDKKAISYAAWARANKALVNALIMKRYASKKRALPKWADLEKIRAFYERAVALTVETGVRHEVDHIYPLQSPVVCGLHCEANLQILTKAENLRKRNKMPSDVSVAAPMLSAQNPIPIVHSDSPVELTDRAGAPATTSTPPFSVPQRADVHAV